MVGGLVQQQQRRRRKQRARERHAHAPPARHVLGGAVHHRAGEAQAVEQLSGAGLWLGLWGLWVGGEGRGEVFEGGLGGGGRKEWGWGGGCFEA
jgi:hypothetical protein